MKPDLTQLATKDVQRKLRTERLLCLCLGAFALAIGSAYVLANRSTQDMRGRDALLDRQFADAVRQLEAARKQKEQEARIAEQAALAASLVEKIPKSNVLAELTNSLPSDVWLVGFTLDSRANEEIPSTGSGQAASLPGARHPLFNVRLKLSAVSGSDAQAAQFVSKLGRSKLLRDVTLIPQGQEADGQQGSLRQAQSGLREFHVELALDPDAEIHNEPAIASAGTFAQK